VRFLVDTLRVAEAVAKNLDGEHFASGAVNGAEDAGKGARADSIEHLVVAVEEASARSRAHQFLELILRQQAAAEEDLLEDIERCTRRSGLVPGGLELRIVDDAYV
jgi:hypothetical protein